MTKNLDRGICRIEYNLLNLPVKITYTDGSYVNFSYDAMGNRVISSTVVNMATSGSASSSVQGGVEQSGLFIGKEINHSYSGNILYQDGEPSKLFFQTGYVDLKDDNKYYFIIKDHLGSVREVADAQGNVVQHNEYYAFGGLISDLCTGAGIQGYRFQGKELEREHGLNWNYHGARYADMLTGGWTTVDPLAESFYSISPYAFCANNTAMYIDPNGMASWYTNNPDAIRDFWEKVIRNGNKTYAFDPRFWSYASDDDFLARACYNTDKKFFFYTYTIADVSNGTFTFTIVGVRNYVDVAGTYSMYYPTYNGGSSGNTGDNYETDGLGLSVTAVSMAFPGAEAVYEGIIKANKWIPKNDIVKYVRYMVDYYEIDGVIKTYNLDEVVKTTKRINKGLTVVSIGYELLKDSSSENLKKIVVTTATGWGSQRLFSYVGGIVGGFFGGPIGYAVGYGVGGIIGIGLNYYFSEEVYDKIF
ncbi:MAG: RHS repeat-associated core domain-containing protein [Prevotella sp.]|nr:RHS repeat-associated core domain-containing protein [Prevotella sp.]